MEENNSLEQIKTAPFATLSPGEIDKLDSAEVAPLDLISNYWSPQNRGDFKKVLFDRIAPYPVLDQNTGEIIELDCAFFYVKENGTTKLMRNGSKRLVGAIQAFGIPQGTPLQITYLGRIANRTNANKSDDWSVNPLKVNA